MDDNDTLTYIDSGCTINKDAKMRFDDYVNMIKNSSCGMLRFELDHKERDFTNSYTFKYFDMPIDDGNMLMATVMIMRKTKFTLDLFETIDKIDHFLYTEKYTKFNEKHRHDQSILSLLYKKFGGDLVISDETYGKPIPTNTPFIASRLKN